VEILEDSIAPKKKLKFIRNENDDKGKLWKFLRRSENMEPNSRRAFKPYQLPWTQTTAMTH
jgi:hypothetical protein